MEVFVDSIGVSLVALFSAVETPTRPARSKRSARMSLECRETRRSRSIGFIVPKAYAYAYVLAYQCSNFRSFQDIYRGNAYLLSALRIVC